MSQCSTVLKIEKINSFFSEPIDTNVVKAHNGTCVPMKLHDQKRVKMALKSHFLTTSDRKRG